MDFHQLPKFKNEFTSRHFATLIESVNLYFVDQDATFYNAGIQKLKVRRTNCVNLGVVVVRF